ncbi:DNA-methyltransferase [Paenibacillus campinasensis]|uniref:DNA-methyltransferase n=1 Tax=Paenibacillus campinasensis TaxID=66347 RepID=UPI0015C9CEC4|nr:site-specific DNA-methyltransferase [Paenibacillus campinasensis]
MTEINVVLCGDSTEVLRQYPDAFFDSVVCDPPYGLSKEPNITEVLTKWIAGEPYDHGHGGFMGKSWDSFVPHPDLWREVFRVLKPGGHALVFAGTRTQDLMTIALRLGGFGIRDVIEWLYFSGFPKSMDVGKAFDKRAGVLAPRGQGFNVAGQNVQLNQNRELRSDHPDYVPYSPQSELARKWDGWGTALKPAHEPIIVARKPLAGTVAETVEKYGTGAINIDGCRIATDDKMSYSSSKAMGVTSFGTGTTKQHEAGRFPANCVTTDDDAFYSPYFNVTPREVCKKATKADRGAGNTHPTVKPTALMAWLIRLVTPPGGTVLDPFAGSGSTLVAAKREGFGYVGIEREPEYVDIANARTKEAV